MKEYTLMSIVVWFVVFSELGIFSLEMSSCSEILVF